MKKILIVLVAMIIGISFFNIEAKADCPPGFESDSLVTYEDDCYTVMVFYCIQLDEAQKLVNLNVTSVEFRRKYSFPPANCDYSIVEMYRDNYWDLMNEWADKILAKEAAENVEFPFMFCRDGVIYDFNITTALCQTTEAILAYYIAYLDMNGNLHWQPVYRYKPCSLDAKCLSLYTLCWDWNPETFQLEPRKQLLFRRPDLEGTCPTKKTFTAWDPNFKPIKIEAECKINCQ